MASKSSTLPSLFPSEPFYKSDTSSAADSIDGGVRRAGDIIKAVALGAKAVGIGRPFLCAFTL